MKYLTKNFTCSVQMHVGGRSRRGCYTQYMNKPENNKTLTLKVEFGEFIQIRVCVMRKQGPCNAKVLRANEKMGKEKHRRKMKDNS